MSTRHTTDDTRIESIRIGPDDHPDTDLADPALNTSGVPWHTLYYKANYPRSRRIKARWDPRDIFRHALSIRPG